jgi:hypothetical protein
MCGKDEQQLDVFLGSGLGPKSNELAVRCWLLDIHSISRKRGLC